MQITPIFSVAFGKANNTELLKIARQLFDDNQNKLQQGNNNLFTTLQKK